MNLGGWQFGINNNNAMYSINTDCEVTRVSNTDNDAKDRREREKSK